MIGPAGEVEAPAAVRPDARGDPDRGTWRLGQRPALFDVQLDEGADAAQQVLVGADQGGVVPGGGHGLGQGDPGAIAQRPRRARVHRTGQQPAAQAGEPEPGPLLLAERGDGDGAGRDAAPVTEQVDGGEPGCHAERAVEGAAVRHRIQVAAGHDGPGPP